MITPDVKRKDQELFEAWQKTGDKRAMGQLVTQLSPLIYAEVRRQEGTLPTAALAAEATKWTIRAIKNYDPTKGASLSTHVVSYLPKVRRLNYKYQNAARLPENKQLQFHVYDKALQDLTDRLNRDPTSDEMAAELGWSKGNVVKFKNSLYSDLVESASARPAEMSHFNEEKIMLDHILSSITPEEKIIWEDSKNLTAEELANKLGVNINRLNYLKSKLKNKVFEIKNQIGYY